VIKQTPGFKLGTDNRKQMMILGGLATVAAVIFSFNFFSGSDTAPAVTNPRPPVTSLPPVSDGARVDSTPTVRRRGGTRADLRPVPWRLSTGKTGAHDTSRIDPTLRLDLLARLQTVDAATAGRNLFQLGPAPVPVSAIKVPPKIHPTGPDTAGVGTPPTAPGPPPPPVAPPIDLKYYGFTTGKGEVRRKAFLLDGEEIIMAFEGETVKRRYKVVKVNATSIVMEDTQFKSTQTLPLQPENNG
jgi:hypothetical protein